MPTPVGHALAGLATAWFSRRRPSKLVLVSCLGAAVAPDLDILIHRHRMYTHSVGAVIVVGLITWGIGQLLPAIAKAPAGKKSRSAAAGLALTVAVAYATHILLDWLGKDTAPPRGLEALWPFSSRYYISGADLFMEISRRYWKPGEFIMGNVRAVGWEILVLGPIVALAYWWHNQNKTLTTEDSE